VRTLPPLLSATTALAASAVVRRVARRTGVTDREAFSALPGDEVIPHPMLEFNRGVTIAASPESVWPWLVQMGYGRAGWYTPEALDRWANRWVWRLETDYPFRPSPWRIVPEWQHVAVGDIIADGPRAIWLTPPAKDVPFDAHHSPLFGEVRGAAVLLAALAGTAFVVSGVAYLAGQDWWAAAALAAAGVSGLLMLLTFTPWWLAGLAIDATIAVLAWRAVTGRS
jgi:hypothetical protein